MADSILKLKVESSEYDSKIKRAAQGLQHYADQCRKVGGTLEVVEKDTLNYVKSIGQMETQSRSATGKLSEMRKSFVELSSVYRNMTEQEKQSPVGKALSQSLDQLKVRIKDTKMQLDDINREIGFAEKCTFDFKSVISDLGGRFGVNTELLGSLTSGTIAYTAAIGAAASAVAVATKEWAAYNQELAKQDQVTSVTTGLKGGEAENMTSSMRALSRTYGVDFREAINAANTLMSQFGATGEEAIKLIQDGMQGMIMGDGPKLLSMIQQYAPAFRDAGISAKQLVAVIQNSEGGIFTDENMNAIVMGIKNIRLMTNSTSEALAKLGIDGDEMTQKLNDGSLSIFEALKKVAKAIEGTSSSSQAAGQVMQQVFGRQGAMAGTKLGEAIETLNLNLEETKHQTGEVGAAYNDLYEANKRLETAIRQCFGYDGWETMATGIKSKLVGALADVLDVTVKIKNSWVGETAGTIFDKITTSAINALGPLGSVLSTLMKIRGYTSDSGDVGAGAAIGGKIGSMIPQGGSVDNIPEIVVNGSKPQKSGGSGKTGVGSAKANFWENIAFNPTSDESMKFDPKQHAVASGLRPEDFLGKPDEWEKYVDAITGSIGKAEESIDNLTNWGPEFKPFIEQQQKMTKAAKQNQMAMGLAGQAVNAFGAALSGIEDPGAKTAGMVMQALGSIALGFAMASAQANTAGTGWGWLAWVAAGLTAMTTAISTVHQLTGYAEGGIVKGNSYSGDNIYGGEGMINAGELVLTKAQQGNIASQLQGNGLQNMNIAGRIKGTDIILAIDRSLKLDGKQLLTWGR